MEVIIVFLSSLGGALIGASIGILLMYRRTTIPPTEAERLVLTAKLHGAEVSMAAAVSTAGDLQRQLAEREAIWQAAFAEVNQRHEQLDQALAEAREHEAKRAEAEQIAQDLTSHITALNEQCATLDARATQERTMVIEQASQQFVAYENQLAIAKRQNLELAQESARRAQELAAETTRLNAELDQFKVAHEQEILGRTAAETERLAQLTASHEQEALARSAAETRLAVERERSMELATRLADLENERSQFDLKLVQERQSASKGMELLLAAQENLSRLLLPLCAEANGHATNGHAAAALVEETEAATVSAN